MKTQMSSTQSISSPVSRAAALADRIEEGAALIRAVRSGKQILQCGMQQRSWTHFRDAVELIQGGSLGRIVQVRTYWWQNYRRNWPPKAIDVQALDWKLWLGSAPDQPFSEEKYNR